MPDPTTTHPASRPVYVRRDPASDAARFARLLKATSEGQTLSQFSRAEGIRVQTLNSWLAARPVYAEAVAHLRRGSAPRVTGREEAARLAAVRHRKAGLRWKQAARLAGVEVGKVQSWFYRHRPEVSA
jgi:hypothetical protein